MAALGVSPGHLLLLIILLEPDHLTEANIYTNDLTLREPEHEVQERSQKPELPRQCLPMNVSACKTSVVPAWHYNTKLNKCTEYQQGACAKASGIHTTREDCVKACMPEVCRLDSDTGSCRASIELYYYDHMTRSCSKFTYGGCQGNENRFDTYEACHKTCGSSYPPCEIGLKFVFLSEMSVTHGWRQSTWFVFNGEHQCKWFCVETDFSWGTCMAYSVREKWWGYECFLFDRTLTPEMTNPNSFGVTRNRGCNPVIRSVRKVRRKEVAAEKLYGSRHELNITMQ